MLIFFNGLYVHHINKRPRKCSSVVADCINKAQILTGMGKTKGNVLTLYFKTDTKYNMCTSTKNKQNNDKYKKIALKTSTLKFKSCLKLQS